MASLIHKIVLDQQNKRFKENNEVEDAGHVCRHRSLMARVSAHPKLMINSREMMLASNSRQSGHHQHIKGIDREL